MAIKVGINGFGRIGRVALPDTEGIVDDLGHGGQTVGGAGGVGHHVHIRGVLQMVDAHDEGGHDVILGRG